MLQRIDRDVAAGDHVWLQIRLAAAAPDPMRPFLEALLCPGTQGLFPTWAAPVEKLYRLKSPLLHVVLLLTVQEGEWLGPDVLSHTYIVSLEGLCHTQKDQTYVSREQVTEDQRIRGVFEQYANGDGLVDKAVVLRLWQQKEEEFGVRMSDRQLEDKLFKGMKVGPALTYEQFSVLWLRLEGR